MLKGEFTFDKTFSESSLKIEVTTQFIFVAFFFLCNIVLINILIGVGLMTIKKMLTNQEDFKLVRKALSCIKIEKMLKTLKVTKKLKADKCLNVCLSLEERDQNEKKCCNILDVCEDYKVDVFLQREDGEISGSNIKLLSRILDRCKDIMTFRKEKEAALAEAEATGGFLTRND